MPSLWTPASCVPVSSRATPRRSRARCSIVSAALTCKTGRSRAVQSPKELQKQGIKGARPVGPLSARGSERSAASITGLNFSKSIDCDRLIRLIASRSHSCWMRLATGMKLRSNIRENVLFAIVSSWEHIPKRKQNGDVRCHPPPADAQGWRSSQPTPHAHDLSTQITYLFYLQPTCVGSQLMPNRVEPILFQTAYTS